MLNHHTLHLSVTLQYIFVNRQSICSEDYVDLVHIYLRVQFTNKVCGSRGLKPSGEGTNMNHEFISIRNMEGLPVIFEKTTINIIPPILFHHEAISEPEFVNLLRSPVIDFQGGTATLFDDTGPRGYIGWRN